MISHRPDLARKIVDEYLAANPDGQRTDLVVTVTDTITETARIVTRPMTDEERAQAEIARRIDVAAEKIAARGISRKEQG